MRYVVTPHALHQFRHRLGSTEDSASATAAIVRALGNIVSDVPDASGRGRMVRTAPPLELRAVLAPGKRDGETAVVTILHGRHGGRGGDIAGQKARRAARKARDMTPLVITAHLVNGYVVADRWSPALDGVLAAVIMRERLGSEYAFSAAQPSKMTPVEGLPLERVEHGDLWWYACSSPILPGAHLRERRWFHRRFDDTEAATRTSGKRVTTSAGPYKGARLSELRNVVASVSWHAVGDASEVERLLHKVDAIGAGRARGHGQVTGWTVAAGDDTVRASAMSHRPLPVAYAEARGVTGPTMLASIRPPGRLACNTVECVVP